MSAGVSGAGRTPGAIDTVSSGSSGAMPAVGAAGDAGGPPASGRLQHPDLLAVARGEKVLGVGDRGEGVKALQEALQTLGKLPPASNDGVFGRGTERALAAFQRDQGLSPDGKLGKQTLAALDRSLAGGGAARTSATPAPDPLRRPPASYLTSETERRTYEEVKRLLFTGASWRYGLDAAVTNQDTLAILDKLETLQPASYNRLLHALAATKEDDPFNPTLLDKFVNRGTSQFGNATLSLRFCEQLERKYRPLGASPETKIMTHISPDSVSRLEGWAGWGRLKALIS
jgi:peptidoglycan hydrolase-like protein with peptidoglycan-binding domain